MTKMQELLGRILRNRINAEKESGTLENDKVNLNETLDIFLAGNKITAEQYAEFSTLITPSV